MNSDAITKVLYCTLLFRRHFFRLLGRLLTACHVSLCTKQTHRPCCCCAGALDQRYFSVRCCGCQLFWFCGNLAGLLSWQPFWLNIVPRLLTSFALLDVFQASVDFLLYLSVWHLCYMFCALVLLPFILFFLLLHKSNHGRKGFINIFSPEQKKWTLSCTWFILKHGPVEPCSQGVATCIQLPWQILTGGL